MIEQYNLDYFCMESYRKFLSFKGIPSFSVVKDKMFIDSEYLVGGRTNEEEGELSSFLFDYQKFIVRLVLKKKRFAVFSECGTGKTLMFLELIDKIRNNIEDKKILIISPLMILDQTLDEYFKFYKKDDIENLYRRGVESWLEKGKSQIAIVNYDKFHQKKDLYGKVGCIIIN